MRFLFLAIMMMVAVQAAAQSVTGSDQLGIFFDEAATINGIEETSAAVIPAYLILINPSGNGGIWEWESLVEVNRWDPDPPVEYAILGAHRYGQNIGDQIPGTVNSYLFVVRNDQSSLQPLLPQTILADLTIEPLVEHGTMLLYAVGGSYWDVDGTRIEFNVASGDRELPVAAINAEAPVDVVPESWGAVKTLFRD